MSTKNYNLLIGLRLSTAHFDSDGNGDAICAILFIYYNFKGLHIRSDVFQTSSSTDDSHR